MKPVDALEGQDGQKVKILEESRIVASDPWVCVWGRGTGTALSVGLGIRQQIQLRNVAELFEDRLA
ncbi:MAG: hypothetical protein ACK5TN_05170 [Acidobacteriota bacterium]